MEKKPTFFWQGLLILLPLTLLLAFGVYSLQQDRKLVDVEAGERLQRAAQDFARPLEAHLQERLRHVHPEAHVIINNEGELVSIAGSTNCIRVAELSPGNLQPGELSPKLAALWEQARTAEFTAAEPAKVIAAYQRFVNAHPPDNFLALAKYSMALQWLKSKSSSMEPEVIFRELEKDKTTTSDAGLPLHVLAAMQRLELTAQSPRPAAFTNLLVEVCSNAVDQPSVITPMILQRAIELEHAFTIGQLNTNAHPSIASLWRDEWQREEAAREMYATIAPALHRYPDNFWVDWGSCKTDPCLVIVKPELEDERAAIARTQAKRVQLKATGNYDLQWLTASQLQQAIRDVESEAHFTIPDYASIDYEVAGRRGTRFQGLKEAHYKTSVGNGLEFVVFARVTRPQLLYAHQRQRTLLFAGLIAISGLAACIGLVTARRGFHQQLRLNEMKSNFVSSVSHELRAPIASVRLLAEALDRGAVSEEPKRKEYFRFIVQECRRLTGLIENVLDFSRIEQGRKQYRFEETDLRALVEQTVKLMQPSANERGVTIVSSKFDVQSSMFNVVCDGLAVQQALVNLIDNAIKHSPAGERVEVRLEEGEHRTLNTEHRTLNESAKSTVRLSVMDHGAGIPVEEHQKIFERFYRRGSELRRETQGIGIGLTIVKHVAEAHGGRVWVESVVGTGSKFTIELPIRKQS